MEDGDSTRSCKEWSSIPALTSRRKHIYMKMKIRGRNPSYGPPDLGGGGQVEAKQGMPASYAGMKPITPQMALWLLTS